jgi:comEA protein
MRKSLQILFLIVVVASLTTTAFASEPVAAASNAGVVNINTADASQLAFLPGIGAKTAQRIVEYRAEHGPFKKTSELPEVKGIGDKTFARLSSYLVVDGKTTLTSDIKTPRKPRAKKPATPASN